MTGNRKGLLDQHGHDRDQKGTIQTNLDMTQTRKGLLDQLGHDRDQKGTTETTLDITWTRREPLRPTWT